MRQADLEHKASELLAKHRVAGPPVSVERVAQGEGARIARRPFDDDDLSGMLYREPRGPAVIAVNSRNAPTRQRFTIAHEIAHLLLHEPTLQVDRPISGRFRDERSALAVDRDEIEANQFAAALLMPREWVLTDADRLMSQRPTLSDEAVVEELAERYAVSRQAMEFRLANLGLWTPL
jgi:Zn-dependent peptidase ImmA (M78 family)